MFRLIQKVHYKKIKAIDRGFVHGDIVASASDPNGQTCTVVDVVLTVDLQLVKTGRLNYRLFGVSIIYF